MKNQKNVHLTLFCLCVSLCICLLLGAAASSAPGNDDTVYAQTEDNRIKKIVTMIRNAGLNPREAKYYRVIEE